MIDFAAFSDEFQKIAQPNVQHAMKHERRKKLKGVGALGGAIAGAAGGKSVASKLGPKGRILAMLAGAGIGGLGGTDIGAGAHRALG
jgi:hypothetical protein